MSELAQWVVAVVGVYVIGTVVTFVVASVGAHDWRDSYVGRRNSARVALRAHLWPLLLARLVERFAAGLKEKAR